MTNGPMYQAGSRLEAIVIALYKVTRLLMDMGWVDLDLGVPLADHLCVPKSHQPRQNLAHREPLNIQVN